MNTRQILRNIASSYGRMIVGMVTGVVLTPFILSKLGLEALGLLALTTSVASYFSLTDLGVTNAAVRYISHYRALKDWPNLNKTIGSTAFCYLGMATFSLVAAINIAVFAPSLFPQSESNIGTLRLLILNVGLVSVAGFISVLPIQCVIAAQRQDVLNLWSTAIQVLTALLTVLGLMLGAGILLLAGLQLLNGVLNGAVGYALSRRYLPQARFSPRWDREQGKLLSSFAGLATLIALASRIIYNTDALVITTLMSFAAAGSYSLALKAVEIMRGLVGAAAGVLGTFVSEQNALGNQNSLGLIWSQGTKCSLLITLPVSGVLIFLGPQLLRVWLGTTRATPAMALAMGWLAIGQVFDLAQSTAYQVLMNSGKHKVLALLMICEAGANLILSIILIHFLGIVGVAIGTSIPLVVRSLIFYPWYMPRVTGLPLRDYVRESVLPALCASLPAILLAAVCKYGHFSVSLGSLPALGLGIAIVTIASAYVLCLNGKQKSKLKATLARRIRRNAAAHPA